ncbi:MAG: hypothetical protein MUF34_28965 [Polyangiaceae bacterium]|jgi:hypothetical protein|nr:hypothetical protein [Polyangiaceae bacterium]
MKKPAKQVDTSHFSEEQLAASDGGALATVASLGADEQADLIDAWVARGNAAAVAAVAREDEAPSPARKAARRALNVLKARGVTIPERTAQVRPFAQAAGSTLEAQFSPPDPTGTGLVSFLTKTPGRDTRVVDVLVREGAGIAEIREGMTSGSRLREWAQENKRRVGFASVPVPLEWARWRVAVARAQNAQSGLLLPLNVDQFDDLFGPAPTAAPPHPVLGLGLEVDEVAIARALPDSESLHNEPEYVGFLPDRGAVSGLMSKLGEALASRQGVETPQDGFASVLRDEVAAATDRFFTPEVRQRVAERMLDGALSLYHRVGPMRAKDALAVRDAVLRAGLVTEPPREIAFLRFFFDKAVMLMASRSGGQLRVPVPQTAPADEPGEGRLVLSAEQLAAVQAAGVEEQPAQGGGIIMP